MTHVFKGTPAEPHTLLRLQVVNGDVYQKNSRVKYNDKKYEIATIRRVEVVNGKVFVIAKGREVNG